MNKRCWVALWAILLGSMACASIAVAADDGGVPTNAPARERELVGLIGDAQKQYSGSGSGMPAKDVREAMQIHVIGYMRQNQAAEDWIGTVKSRGITEGGNAWITIEIGQGAVVSTWQNERDDLDWATMFRPHSALFGAAKGLKIGQTVTFSGTILKSVLATDDEMINRPQFIARFSSLKVGQ